MNHTTKSYQIFKDVYYPLFEKFNNFSDTIFENMDYRPNVDKLYEDFIKSEDYQLIVEANSISDKRNIAINWIVENLFLESYLQVKYDLILENETLPYNIEYKLNNSVDVILHEGFRTVAGAALGATVGGGLALATGGVLLPAVGYAIIALSAIAGLGDKDRENIVKGFSVIGKAIGKTLTANIDTIGTGTKKEILAMIDAKELADNINECASMINWDPNNSNKIKRFIERIMNSNKEYEYAQCVGTKLIKFYVSTLSALYKILSASDVDDKVFDVMENGLRRGALNEMLFRNMARLSRDKNVYKLIEVINKVNDALNNIIEKFTHSSDSEYARIGHNLSKILDSDLRNLAYQISKEMKSRNPRPALNRRQDGTEIMKDKPVDRFAKDERFNQSTNRNSFNNGGRPDNRNSYNNSRPDNRDNRNNFNNNRSDSRNPF